MAVTVVAGLLVVVVGDVLVAWQQVESLAVEPTGSPPGGQTYLLVGLDRRPSDEAAAGVAPAGARADVLVVVRVPDDGEARALSVPRDLLVSLPDGGVDRIGTRWDRRPQEVLDAVCAELGLGVDHVVAVDLAGFAELVEAVEGVDVTVPEPIRDGWVGVDLPAGPVHLDGPAALDYVRSRRAIVRRGGAWVAEPDPAGSRARRAAEVLDALVADARSSWRWPPRLHDLLWSGADALAADPGLGLGDARRLADALAGARGRIEALPVDVQGTAVPVATLADGADASLATVDAGPDRCAVPEGAPPG